MTIEFRCPFCQQTLRTPDDKAGFLAKCPECGSSITVPSPGRSSDYEAGPRAAAAEPASHRGQPPPPPQQRASGMRSCPMCGETIRVMATRCRYCGEVLEPLPGQPQPIQSQRSVRRSSAQTNQLAIVSMVLGITSIVFGCCCGLCGLPIPISAIICGFIALSQTREGQGSGKEMAIAGIVCGFVAIAIALVLLILNLTGVLPQPDFKNFAPR